MALSLFLREVPFRGRESLPRRHRFLGAGKLSPLLGGKLGGPSTQPWLVVPMARALKERLLGKLPGMSLAHWQVLFLFLI